MKTIILPISKSPHKKGRFGSKQHQDWYRGCALAVSLEKELRAKGDEPEVLVLTDFHKTGDKHEAEHYVEALKELGAKSVREIREGVDTIGQIEFVTKLAKDEGKRLIVISTSSHYFRIKWISRGHKIEHRIAYGIPRPRELVTDIILWGLFPLVDLLGKRPAWHRFVEKRRKSGKF